MVRRATLNDINHLVKLHLENLQDGLLYRLGKNTLSCFYKEAIMDNSCFVFLFCEESRILGVAASSDDSFSFFGKVKKKYFFTIAYDLMRILFFDISLLFKLMNQGKYPMFPKSELMMLYVENSKRSKGIGKKLIEAANSEYKYRGVNIFKITILSDNLSGRKFYEKSGFLFKGDFFYMQEKRSIYYLTT